MRIDIQNSSIKCLDKVVRIRCIPAASIGAITTLKELLSEHTEFAVLYDRLETLLLLWFSYFAQKS